MLSWILYAVIGRFLVFLGMKFELPEKLEKIKWLESLHSCSLCMGTWIYVSLSFLLKVDILESWFGFWYVPVLSEIVTGGVTSYLIWLLVIGFKEAHLNVTVI